MKNNQINFFNIYKNNYALSYIFIIILYKKTHIIILVKHINKYKYILR